MNGNFRGRRNEVIARDRIKSCAERLEKRLMKKACPGTGPGLLQGHVLSAIPAGSSGHRSIPRPHHNLIAFGLSITTNPADKGCPNLLPFTAHMDGGTGSPRHKARTITNMNFKKSGIL